MTRPLSDFAASVRARLLRRATERGEDFELVLTRYANERVLQRLAHSPYAGQFILKGATLFTIWTGQPHRATRDVDLLGFGDPSIAGVRAVFADILALHIGEDGVRFDEKTLRAGPIREGQVYQGVRVAVQARIATAVVRLQFDVGFGDAVTPCASEVEVPALLDGPPLRLRAYPRETVIAEKIEAVVQLGLANSRMKDFYDLAVLARSFAYEGDLLVRAIRATFERRGTPLPRTTPPGLTPEFFADHAKYQQWRAFLRKTGAADFATLADAAGAVSGFLTRPLEVAAQAQVWDAHWPAGGPWREMGQG